MTPAYATSPHRGKLRLLLPAALLLILTTLAPRGGNCTRPGELLKGDTSASRVANARGVSAMDGWELAPRVYARRLEDHEVVDESEMENEETKKKEVEEEEATKKKELEALVETKKKEVAEAASEEERQEKEKEAEEEITEKKKEVEEEIRKKKAEEETGKDEEDEKKEEGEEKEKEGKEMEGEEEKEKEKKEKEKDDDEKEDNDEKKDKGEKKDDEEKDDEEKKDNEEKDKGKSGGLAMRNPEEEEDEGTPMELMPGRIGSASSEAINKKAEVAQASRGAASGKAIAWPGIRGTAGPVQYRGGPIMTSPITVYNIFYGSWTAGSATESILSNFVRSLSSTDADWQGRSVRKWWRIATATGYKDSWSRTVTSTVLLGKSTYVNNGGFYSRSLSENDIGNIVVSQIQSGKLPQSVNAIYIVITSADVAVGTPGRGFCDAYCGWHTYYSYNGRPVIRFAFVGDGSRCGGCRYYSQTINGDLSGDSIIPAYSHEIVETATDPDLTAYYATAYGVNDANGALQENADLCNGVYKDASYPLQWGYNWRGQQAPFNVYGINGFRHFLYFNVNLYWQQCVLQA